MGYVRLYCESRCKSNEKHLTNCLAISVRTYWSVDRMQIHNDHLQANLIHPDRSDSLYFLGFGESEKWGAKGYLAARKQACKSLLWEDIFGPLHRRVI